MSDFDAKPTAARKRAGGSGRGGSGKNGGRLGDVGHALSAAYKNTLKEEIPADLLALLGKLD